jgi:hypothetical protein
MERRLADWLVTPFTVKGMESVEVDVSVSIEKPDGVVVPIVVRPSAPTLKINVGEDAPVERERRDPPGVEFQTESAGDEEVA